MNPRRVVVAAAATLALTLPASFAIATQEDSAAASSGGQTERPNIVFVTTDDQRASDLRWMPFTRRLLGGHGVTFTNGLSPHPLCCPARAEWVTGQYGQNNGVHHNEGSYGGYGALRQPSNTLAAWLDASGYQTAMSGKYLNEYHPDKVGGTGWDHWNPSVEGVYSYRHTTFFNDGRERLHTGHVDDVVMDYTQGYIREFAANDAPFFVWASNLSPHNAFGKAGWGPPRAAARFHGTLAGTRNPAQRAPSFNVPVKYGPRAMFAHRDRARMNAWHVARIESLQAVDEGVRDIVWTLRRTGELANTYIVFASDNGFMLGEHGLIEKNVIFEEALRVPILVRVPTMDRGRVSRVPVTLVDIAPTIAGLANVRPRRRVDGVSFARLLHGRDESWRTTQLIQTGTEKAGTNGWQLRGVRTGRWTYARAAANGAQQLYDRARDPFQMVNLASRPGYGRVVANLRHRTDVLARCSGTECSRDFGRVPRPGVR